MVDVKNIPTKSFATAERWYDWLDKHHDASDGIWIRIFKKSSGKKTVSYDEALDGALCYGWIDALQRSYDEISYIQKFMPRRPKGTWSKLNRKHIERLTKAGRMKPAGLKEVEAAKEDGRWDLAYDSPKDMEMPADFMKELKKDKKAFAFFKTLNRANTYAIGWRLQTAKKPETRERRMNAILTMLSNGEKFH